MEDKKCLECEEVLKGRVDKKFCSDYCRNAYNNNVNKDSKNLIRNINNRLRKNHKILTDLNISGKTKVTRTKLYDKGEPEIVTFQDGNKMAKFSMATDDSYKDKEGTKVERAYWHNVVVRGGLVSVVENYVKKGQEIAVEGKLTNRSYETKEGEKRYVTEILVNDLLLLGSK